MRAHRWYTPYLLVLPAMALFAFAILGPVLATGVFSFYEWDGFGAFTSVGIDNYIKLFRDETGRRAVVNTLIYVAVVMPCSIILSLSVAVGIHSVSQWSSGAANFLRTAYFMPVVATLVAMATVWQMLLHPSLVRLSDL